jgi:PPOX class probable F420-dependent enzyme
MPAGTPTWPGDEGPVNTTEARRRFVAARVATLATVDGSGTPHQVPVTFAVSGDTLWTAVDAKPKRGVPLRRHANIAVQPRVSLLAQHWDEDWAALWWVRADGAALVTDAADTVRRATESLRAKYPQYQRLAVGPPIIEVRLLSFRGWQADPAAG